MTTHDECAHAWANRTGRKRNAGRVFYEGDTIYSYGHHFAIARWVNVKGQDLVLFTSRGYSASTAKHKTIVHRAIPLGATVVEVNDPARFDPKSSARDHLDKAVELAAKALRRRVEEYAAWDRNTAASHVEQARRIVALWDVEGVTIPDTLVALAATAREDARLAAIVEAQRKRDASIAARTSIRAWLQGITGLRPHHTPTPYVRVDGNRVQTSWGVEAPLALALRVFRKAQEVRGQGLKQPLMVAESFLNYGAAYVNPNGDIRVGCHLIRYRIAQLAACKAGLLKA